MRPEGSAAVTVMDPDALLDAFPRLAELRPEARGALLRAGQDVTIEAGTVVFEAGQACAHYPLIRSGSVRVHLMEADGHEIVLYRLGRGDTCILTTAALLGSEPYTAWAVTEARTQATAIPAALFSALMATEAAFRHFVFATYARRIADLMRTVSDVAFTRIQVRLARCLLDRADPAGRVGLTHEALAVELGTAREVVSRNLKLLERRGLVRLGQASVTITNARRLTDLALPPATLPI